MPVRVLFGDLIIGCGKPNSGVNTLRRPGLLPVCRVFFAVFERPYAADLDADVRLSPPRPALIVPAPAPTTPPSRSRRKPHPRLPPPGTILTRPYKGENLQVRVLRHGLEFEGTVYPSLSAVAKAITGSHCSGYLFFRLTPKGVAP